VLCTGQRSGSSLLAGGLRNTGCAGRPAEYFDRHDNVRDYWISRLGIQNESEYFEKVIAAGTTPNGVFGLKLHWSQTPALREAFTNAYDVDPAVAPQLNINRLFSLRFASTDYVWLRRRNSVAQAISYYRALQTSVWWKAAGAEASKNAPAHEIAFDFAEIDRLVQVVEGHDRQWQEYFARNQLNPRVVVYEEFIENYEATIRAICRQLRVDAPALKIDPPAMERQADATSVEWEGEYRKIKQRDEAVPSTAVGVGPLQPPAPRLRVAVYAIALNEIKHVERFLRSCAGADLVLIADTGSTDGTPEALRQGGAVVHDIRIRPWRFDDARNAALALVPADIDVCIALDLDEELSHGWRDALERGWTPQTTLGRYRYVTAHLPDGQPSVEISGTKIHRRFGYHWRHLCHEVLVADRLTYPLETPLRDLQVDHWPDASKGRTDFYLSLLEAAVAEDPDDARDLFMLGRQYEFMKRWNEAEVILRRYLKIAGERWPQQRAAAWRRLAGCHEGRNNSQAAIACLQEGLRIVPEMRDLWLDLADLHAKHQDWQASFDASRRGLALPIFPGGIANDPVHAGGRPFHKASLSALQLGLTKEAVALAAQASAREPGNQLYQKQLKELQNS
jgi:LPS sulfotransferase NodH